MSTAPLVQPTRRWHPDIARGAWQEARSRKLLVIGVVVSVVFVSLFTLAYVLASDASSGDDPLLRITTQNVLTVLGLYAVQFLAGFLAIVLGAATVAAEVESGRALAVLARPVSRTSWLVQRTGTFAVLAVGYVVLMGGGVLLVVGVASGYGAVSPVRGLGLLVAEVLLLLLTATALSTRLSTTAAASVTVALYGVAWLGGIAEFIGSFSGADTVARVGVAISLAMPSDALWRAASYHLSSPLALSADLGLDELPFSSAVPPSGLRLLWAAGYATVMGVLAVRRLRRLDL